MEYSYRFWHDFTFTGGSASESTNKYLNTLEDLIGGPVLDDSDIVQLSFENWIVIGINLGLLKLPEALDIRNEVFGRE